MRELSPSSTVNLFLSSSEEAASESDSFNYEQVAKNPKRMQLKGIERK
jgi:hypothetical protein